MRFRHRASERPLHLSYCSNVHPAEDVDGIIAQLPRFARPVREELGAERLGLGLWLPEGAAWELARNRATLRDLKVALDVHGLEVVTLNGFPYRGFHDPVVKQAVYRPDWSQQERLDYTLDLAVVLAALLPDDVGHGSISTLPFGWREQWSEASTKTSLELLHRLADELETLERSGSVIQVGLEPEPGCVVERTDQAAELLSQVDARYVGVCLDACHLAVQFQDPLAAVAGLVEADVPVVKAQISTALRVRDPQDASSRAAVESFVEPRFCHQTRELRPSDEGEGEVVGTDDLDEALAGGLPGEGEWRVHFHTPVHWAGGDAGVGTTQAHLRETLEVLVGGPEPVTHHLDVETYTWTVLPPEQRPHGDAGLVEGLTRELLWTKDRLTELGLEEM